MKKTVPFELFGANQYLMFDIIRLAEFEKAMGISVLAMVQGMDIGVRFCVTALPIAMRQHYHKATPQMFAEKITEYLSEPGRSINDIALPLVEAISLTGVFGTPDLADDSGENENEKNE